MRIALCTPCHSRPELWFSVSWLNMALHTQKELGAELRPFFTMGSHIDASRNKLVDQALEWGADYILWADTDHVFPADACTRLLSHGKAVVGANYAKRERPTSPTAGRMVDGKPEPVFTTPELVHDRAVEQVGWMGLGLCLMETAAIANVPRPLFGGSSEDLFFFSRLGAAGIPAFVDHALSWEVGHITVTVTTNADANRDRAKKGLT